MLNINRYDYQPSFVMPGLFVVDLYYLYKGKYHSYKWLFISNSLGHGINQTDCAFLDLDAYRTLYQVARRGLIDKIDYVL
mmetsp:Transcript_20265/g.46927  ORF Transcript_20265/g.46927 Transcript_20265/m.46927 type:complete len:80 (-) Transcript_20265:1350-1589(-)